MNEPVVLYWPAWLVRQVVEDAEALGAVENVSPTPPGDVAGVKSPGNEPPGSPAPASPDCAALRSDLTADLTSGPEGQHRGSGAPGKGA